MPKGKSKTSSTKPEKEPPSGSEFTFIVLGRPVPKGRPRMTRRGRVYTPKESILAEELIAETIGEAAPTFTGPGSVEMIFNKEETWSEADFTKKEMIAFLEGLGSKQFKELEQFFTTMPKLTHELKITNPKTKVKSEVVLEGLASFFA